MSTDPVCGMKVEEAAALRAQRDGQTFYFCSEHCRQKFQSQAKPTKAPALALTKAAHGPGGVEAKEASATVEHSCCGGHDHSAPVKPSTSAKYFCPMCPGVESDQPGDCPKCGMALERNPAWVSASKTIYTCPMHPEVQQDHPGDCPKCGMALELKTVKAATSEDDNAELRDMTRRLWIGGALTLPVFVLAMAHLIPALGHPAMRDWVMSDASRWIQFALSTPVVLWAGWQST